MPASFDGGVTVPDSAPETTAPRLDSLDLGATSVDTTIDQQTLDVTAISSDGAVRGEVSGTLNGRSFRTALEGDESGTLRGQLVVPRGVGDGSWTVQIVSVLDAARNRADYHAADLTGDLQNSFQVTSVTDETKPQLSGFKISPGEVDVRHHKVRVDLEVRARDAGVGVDHVFATITPPSGYSGAELALHLASGDAHDGIWRGHVTLTTCQRWLGLWRSIATTYDFSNNRSRLFGPRLAVRAPDNHLSEPHGHRDGPYKPAVVRFPETVTGVSRSSALVQTHVGGRVTGSWTCLTQAGVRTPCVREHVRRALFTPDQPWKPKKFYELILNPEHILELRDLAGNPYRRALVHMD
jgi:hypothetical protein